MISQTGLIRYFRKLSCSRSQLIRFYGYVAKKSRTYNDAIELLNTLQTPHKKLKPRPDSNGNSYAESNVKLRACLLHLGYSISDLNRLNIVHITGTKGKGSICAYVDSILNKYRLSNGLPLRVGLYTSPHLVSVRERIKIDSTTISAEKFTKYFFEVWDRLEQPSIRNGTSTLIEKPVYFRYLTLLSYHIFLQEQVNTAIYEVGIGGEYDSTNIVECPLATGISTIGIDHTSLLGNTLSSIAWNKAGILKKNCPNFYVDQKPEALAVICERAEERQVKSSQNVKILPQLEKVKIQPTAKFQQRNATLAIYLSHTALQKLDPNYNYSLSTSAPLPSFFVDGLEQVIWRGRCEKIVEKSLTWYLDGAHNSISMKVALKWFAKESIEELHGAEPIIGRRILIFNQQGRRDSFSLLEDLHREAVTRKVSFDHVIFCPTEPEECDERKDCINLSIDRELIYGMVQQKQFAEMWKSLGHQGAQVHVLRSLEKSIKFTRDLSMNPNGKYHVLTTGSVHLVGRALGILEGVESL
ncbi:Folylpolyglutamate synthase [Golovinomyces cichoracearum]|uniref:Folylpolyglutamate synthase n=1 Tax=Golovinomyces cichoracearum TaxID=62708 RepID=A0A420IPR1_9PEZI|nr:Folylpolyglutamate synthase [Golovinomyces cichoracearum]